MKTFSKFRKTGSLLSKEEMKKITGGACGYTNTQGGTTITDCDVSSDVAQYQQATFGGYWCCSSCGSTSYCGMAASSDASAS